MRASASGGAAASDPASTGDGTDGGRDTAAPGLRDQLGRTVGAAKHLLGSHVELAKAEIGDILEEVKRVAAFAGIAIGAVVLMAILLVVGLFLFVGEAVFGSLGWGVLHGTLLLLGVAVAMVLVALGVSGGRIARSLGLALVIGVAVGAVLGLDLTNRAWTALGDAVAGPVAADVRPLAAGAATLAAIGGLLGLIIGARGGGFGGAIAGLLVGAILGAAVGALTAIALGPQIGAAIGLAVALLAWLVLMGISVARHGIDVDALKARFLPRETIDTTKETIEWVREQTPLGPKS